MITTKGIISSIKDIQNFDNGCISSTTELSQIIQTFEDMQDEQAGKFSHAFKIIQEPGELRNIEADEPGIVSNPFTEYLISTTVSAMLILRPKFTHTPADEDYALSFVNKMKYDFLGLGAEAIRYITEYAQKEYDKVINGNLTGQEHGLWVGKNEAPITSMCGEFCGIVDNHAYQKSTVPNGVTIGLDNTLMPGLKLNEITPTDLILCQYYDVYIVDLPALRKEAGL
jgi:hypothetical protein